MCVAELQDTNGTVVGVLNSDITAATVCPFLDFNLNSQLGRFGLHNGGDQDAALLNEKWESIALLPVSEGSDEYYLFSASDDDFITQDGKLTLCSSNALHWLSLTPHRVDGRR
jgi:hypothetical protein